jgi:hypothetical protein
MPNAELINAQTTYEGKKKIEEGTYAVYILSDLGGEWKDLAELIRQKQPKSPVILFSAMSSESEADKAGVSYLYKSADNIQNIIDYCKSHISQPK